MNPALVLREAAFDDIDAAERWYEEKEPGLGTRFVDAVERTLALVGENPQAYPVVENTIHRAVVRKFPYSVFYVPEDDRVAPKSWPAFTPARLSVKWIRSRSYSEPTGSARARLGSLA
ncbi:MAG: type II toxin-antitoxin system RelE/ParE family toxin [Myxococcota bacterium]